jgi:hypothetical protein
VVLARGLSEGRWLPLVEPENATDADGPMYPGPKAGYISRGLSSVPQSLRDYWPLANEHYLPGQYVYKFDTSIRAISRPQTEILVRVFNRDSLRERRRRQRVLPRTRNLKLAEKSGSRTHQGSLRPLTGFEVQAPHRGANLFQGS